MIDIHSHILPAVDDGAESLETAVAMCRAAAADGCSAIFATPHQRTPAWWNCDPQALEAELDAIRAVVGSSPEIHLGGEIRVGQRLLEALAEPDRGGALALGGSSYLLLEFDRRGMGALDPEGFTHELKLAGWRPVYAHPEFIPELAADFGLMQALFEIGASFQLTAMSLTGGFGRRRRIVSEKMLEAGLIDFIASDAHDLSRRPPGLSRAFQYLEEEFGESLARRLMHENPLAIVENRPLP